MGVIVAMPGFSQPSGAQRQNSLDKIKTLEMMTGRMVRQGITFFITPLSVFFDRYYMYSQM